MTTTAVFAELLVVGLQAAAWIGLAALAAFGTSWVELGAVDAWATLITILVLAAAYVLGILVDRIADSLGRGVALRIQEPAPGSAGPGFQRKRLEVLYRGSDGMAKFLDYQRSRQRVARGTIVNVLCAIPALVAFLALRTDASVALVVGAAVLGLLVAFVAVYANERIHEAYSKNLEQAYELVRQ